MRAVFFAVLLAGLGIAAPASAVTPVSLGIGRSPAVAVDAAGTGHFVWASRDSGGHTAIINYCRIPPVSSPVRAASSSRPWAPISPSRASSCAPPNGAIIVIDSRCCNSGSPGMVDTYDIISTTGGTTWQPPVDIGSQFVAETGVTLTPDGTAVDRMAGGTGLTVLQRDLLTGPQESREINFDLRPDMTTGQYWYDGQLGYLPGGGMLEVMGDLTNLARVYAGGDLYAQASWAPNPPTVIGPGDNASLVSGPTGVFLLSTDTGLPRPAQLRAWTGSGFTPPYTLSPGQSPNTSNLFEDGGGALHAVWAAGGTLDYVRSTSSGLSAPFALVTSPSGVPIYHVAVAADAAHSGWAVWDDNNLGGIAHAVPLTLATEQNGPPPPPPPAPRLNPHSIILLPSARRCADSRHFVIPIHQPAANGTVTSDRQDQRQARPDRGGQEPGPHPRTQGSAQRHLQGDRGGLNDPRLHHHQHPDLPRLPQDRSS